MGCGNLLSRPNSHHRLETTVYRPSIWKAQKNARTVPKNFLNDSRALPHKRRVLGQIAPRKFTRKFGKIFVAKVLWGTFSVPDAKSASFQRPKDVTRLTWWTLRSCWGIAARRCRSISRYGATKSEHNSIAWSLLHVGSGTEKVPQRNCVTKILPNVRVNFLVQFASKPLFYWVMTGNPLKLFRKFFGAVRAIFWLCGSFLAPDRSLRNDNTISRL